MHVASGLKSREKSFEKCEMKRWLLSVTLRFPYLVS